MDFGKKIKTKQTFISIIPNQNENIFLVYVVIFVWILHKPIVKILNRRIISLRKKELAELKNFDKQN